jgi:hypothetical protein
MQVTALDEADKKVDWFFIYKVPQLSAGATTDKATGYEYVYYDSSIDQQLTVNNRNIVKSPYVLNSDQRALNKTLEEDFSVESLEKESMASPKDLFINHDHQLCQSRDLRAGEIRPRVI